MYQLRLFTGFIWLFLLPLSGFSQSLQLADSLNKQGIDFYESGNYKQAEFYLREAFLLYEKKASPAVWLSPGIDYAEILVDVSKYDRALALFERLQGVALAQNNIRARARIENDLGWTYSKTGRDEMALKYFKRAIPLAEKAQDTLRLGYIYNNIGSVYSTLGDYETSLNYRKKSLSFKEQTNDLKSISITLNNIGLTYKKLGLYDKALRYYEKSLAIRKQLGNIDLLGSAYNNIATLYRSIGQYSQAIIYFNQSLDFFKETGNPTDAAHVLNNIGRLYAALGQTEKGIAYFREALQLKKRFASDASLAVSYSNVAQSLWEAGQNEEAIPYYRRALELRKKVGNPRAVATSMLDIAIVEQSEKNTETAYSYLRQARGIAESTSDTYLLKATSLQLGNFFVYNGDASDAITHYNKALHYNHSIDTNEQINPLKGLAYAYDALNSDSTMHYGQKAIHLIEDKRSQTGPLSQFKAGYFKRHVDFYIDMASWHLKYKADVSSAYKFVESAKARALSDELVQAARRNDESLPENIRIKRAQRLAEITSLYTNLDKANSQEKKTALRNNIRDKELSYASFENSLQRQYQQYKKIKSPEPTSLKRAQSMCDAQTAILEFAVSDERLLIFFISDNKVKTKQFDIDEAEDSADLVFLVERFRKSIIDRSPPDSIAKHSAPLYEKLIKPFKNELQSFKNIIIVPDGVLAYLPFEALHTSTNYLVSTHNVKYVPSITGLSLMSPPREASRKKLLAIANSSNYESSRETPMLPSVGLEIEIISKLFKEATALRDPDLNEENVKAAIQKDYAIVHIAAHSIIDRQNSSMSGIALGSKDDKEGIGNDGYLRSSEIYQLNINSDMVVLSACESGIGTLVNGEGMLGLQRAFFNAGVSTVAVSLWDVYDRSTTHFMKTFYTALMDAEKQRSWYDSWQTALRWVGWDASLSFGKPASAMRQAKLAMLEHPVYKHPVYWAPFVVVGR